MKFKFDMYAALPIFRAVAQFASFTRAAAKLDVSVSALSQTIRQLERHLDVRLFNRTTRRVGLTEEGRAFLARISPALDDITEAFDALRQNRDSPIGVLRITAPRVAARLILQPLIATFMQTYPDIRLEIDVDNGFTDIIASGFDAGIRLSEAVQQDMVAVPLGKIMRPAIVASPAYFARYGYPARPDDLRHHVCLCYRFVSSGAIYRWEFVEPLTPESIAPQRTFELLPSARLVVNDNDLFLHAALNGTGLAYAFQAEAQEWLASGELESVLEEWLPCFGHFYLYYPHREHISPKLRVFVDFMKSYSA